MSHIKESFHIRMSHVTYLSVISHMNRADTDESSDATYEWVISHMKESCHIWVSHVTHTEGQTLLRHLTPHTPNLSHIDPPQIWVMSHTNESCHIRRSHVTSEVVLSRTNRSGTDALPDATYTQLIPYRPATSTSHVTYGWVMSHTNESGNIQRGQTEPCHMKVSCHIRMSHVTYERAMSHTNPKWWPGMSDV